MRYPALITHRPPTSGFSLQVSTADDWGRLFVLVVVGCWGASLVVGFKAALAMLTIWGFAAAVVGLIRPVIGLLGIAMLCTLEPLIQPLLFTGGWWRWHTLDYWLSLVAFAFASLVLGLNDARSRLVQLFAVLMALEVLVSPDWYNGIQNVAGVVALFGLIVYFVRAGTDAAVWCWLGIVCGTTGVVWGIASLGIASMERHASLPYLNPNAWAFVPLTALCGISLAFPLSRLWSRGAVTLTLLASANYTLVFLSGSRGALLTATGCGLVLLVLTRRMRRRWLAALTAVFVAVAIATQFTDLQTRAVDRIHLLLDQRKSLDARTSGRFDLLASGWTIFLQHPLGVGTGGFPRTRTDLVPRGSSPFSAQHTMQAHAGWIKILVENGVPGIALMGAYVLSFAVAGWRSRRRDPFMLGLLVTLGFGLGFVSTEYQSKWLWFLAAGVMVLLRPGSVLMDPPFARGEPLLTGTTGGKEHLRGRTKSS
jgi:O-antigen ligase